MYGIHIKRCKNFRPDLTLVSRRNPSLFLLVASIDFLFKGINSADEAVPLEFALKINVGNKKQFCMILESWFSFPSKLFNLKDKNTEQVRGKKRPKKEQMMQKENDTEAPV